MMINKFVINMDGINNF